MIVVGDDPERLARIAADEMVESATRSFRGAERQENPRNLLIATVWRGRSLSLSKGPSYLAP